MSGCCYAAKEYKLIGISFISYSPGWTIRPGNSPTNQREPS